MNVKDAAEHVAVLRVLADAVGADLKTAEADLRDALREQRRKSGMTKLAVELPDETPIASAVLVQPAPVGKIVDEAAWIAWVRSVMPDEIEPVFTTRVREATEIALLKSIAAGSTTVPQWCDPNTGEVHTVPGVVVQPRAAYPRMTFTSDGRRKVAEAWQRGELTHHVLASGNAPAALPEGAGEGGDEA